MKTLFIAEWAAAMAIISYRAAKTGRPPMPGSLLAVSGLFIALAVLADVAPDAGFVSAAFGAGLDIAAFMNLFGTNPPGAAPAATGTTQAPGTTTAGGRG